MAGINNVKYIIGESTRMLKRRTLSNLISIIIMGFSLLVLVIFLLITMNVSMVIDRGMEAVYVYVYLEDGLDNKRVEIIRNKLLDIEGIKGVIFVSKEEALKKFRDQLGESSEILDELSSNPLPDAFRVQMKPERTESSFMKEIAQTAMGWKGVEEARYGKKWVERGEKLVKGFYMTGLALGLIVFLSVIFVISNTVRLSILSRQKSVEIMKLVGATNSYIQVPFIIEGGVQGVISSGLAMLLLWVVYSFAERYLPGIVFFQLEGVAGFVVLCALLGAAGSFIAVRKFLKR
ncbi:MAG: permease-like cell division protein FtsX [Candidatus Krumholzibacteriota bacterium]|nr:permease-like cell division protein FtsX [Candidatus Krumholzibacteriota bacterium]